MHAAGSGQSSRWGRHLGFAAAALLVCGLHLVLVAYFLPPPLVFSDTPISGGDFSTHLAQTVRVVEGLQQWGKTWVYDPRLLAGYPAGTIFDADNKAWELWTYAGIELGLSFGQSWNSFFLFAHLMPPLVVFLSARLLELPRHAALVAAAMGSAIWFFDSFAHWCWWAGMLEYDIAGYFFLLPFALFWRFIRDKKPWQAVACGLTLGIAHIIHPYTFFMLVVPMVYLWISRRHELMLRDHVLVVGIGLVVVLMNAWWLAVAFSFWHYILDSAYFGQSGLEFLVADTVGVLLNAETTGFLGTRTGFRFLFVAAAIVTIVRWWRRGDLRGSPLGVALGTMILLTYVGGYFDFVAQIQPYRFALSTGFLATIPAACFVVDSIGKLRRGHVGRQGKVLAAVLAIPAMQHLISDVLYFLPDLPPPVARLTVGLDAPIRPTGFESHPVFRHQPLGAVQRVVDWVDVRDRGEGRFLVEVPALGDELAAQTDAQVLGGFTHRNLEHSWSNLYRRRPQGIEHTPALREYFETYAVKWVIASYEQSWFNRVKNPLLELEAVVAGHRIYRTLVDAELVAQGGGNVHHETNRLSVNGSDPEQTVVLRYHWMETLACRPDCRIRRVPIDGVDSVGFIAIPAPHPEDFEIINTYER